MFLSKLILDPTVGQVRRDLSDPYELHRTLTRAFVDGPEAVPVRFLWRLEGSQVGAGLPQVLVQSAHAGRWDSLAVPNGYLAEAHLDKWFDPAVLVTTGARYRFRLLCNPTVTRERKRHGLVKEIDQLAWLDRQGVAAGFVVKSVMVQGQQQLRAANGRGRTGISLTAVQFEGVLEVTDSATLTAAMEAGFGHGKAFGLGLLSVARVG
jgi:CRISPR system Cascade subunit CasE